MHFFEAVIPSLVVVSAVTVALMQRDPAPVVVVVPAQQAAPIVEHTTMYGYPYWGGYWTTYSPYAPLPSVTVTFK